MIIKNKEITPLKLNLQHFAEPTEPQEPKNPEPSANGPMDPKETQEPKNEPQGHMIPKSRFDEVNNNYKTVKEQLDKILQQQEQDELDKQKQQGEFEKLYNQTTEELETYKNDFETTKEKAERLEGVMNSMLNTKLESIPEEFHDLIPENLTSEQKLDWVSKAEAKGLFKDTSQEPLGGQTNPTQQSTDLDNMSVNQKFQSGYKNK